MKIQRILVFSIIVLLAGIAANLAMDHGANEPPPAGAARNASPGGIGSPVGLAASPSVVKATEASIPRAVSSPLRIGRRQEVDALIRSGGPVDALAAFRLLDECARVEITQRRLPSTPDATSRARHSTDTANECRDIPVSQLARRLDLLTPAMRAGSAEAALAFYQAGPNGDWGDAANRPDDPGIAQWKKERLEELEQHALRGSVDSMATLAEIYQDRTSTSFDLVRAIAHEAAVIRSQEWAGRAGLIHRRTHLEKLRSQAGPAQRKAADELSERFVAACCR